MVSGTKASPGCQVRAGGELSHIRTNFGQNRGRGIFFDPWNRLQQGVRLPELFCIEPRTDLDVQHFNLLFEKIDVPQSVPQ